MKQVVYEITDAGKRDLLTELANELSIDCVDELLEMFAKIDVIEKGYPVAIIEGKHHRSGERKSVLGDDNFVNRYVLEHEE